MAKSKEYTLKSILEIKIYILFVLDRVRYPIDYATLTEIIFDTTMSVSIDYDTCIRELADDGMLIADEFDGERYYMISDRGREISAELYDTLDPAFREHTETLVMKHLKLAAIETHVADARTCCLHPASATHRQMNDEELIAAGVSGDLVRLSCGLESADDLIADLAQALETV